MADRLRRKVASGEYASESEMIADGLALLEDDKETFERWLREDVIAACKEFEANPSSAISAEELLAKLERARETPRSA
jgi:Arc/MetJ-type ribon-helix-helix transcriptional regulator